MKCILKFPVSSWNCSAFSPQSSPVIDDGYCWRWWFIFSTWWYCTVYVHLELNESIFLYTLYYYCTLTIKCNLCAIKGIVSRDWDCFQLFPNDRSEEFCVAEHIFNYFWRHFCFKIIKSVLWGSHLTVTLLMMIDSRSSAPVINAHLPIHQACGRYCSNCREYSIK